MSFGYLSITFCTASASLFKLSFLSRSTTSVHGFTTALGILYRALSTLLGSTATTSFKILLVRFSASSRFFSYEPSGDEYPVMYSSFSVDPGSFRISCSFCFILFMFSMFSFVSTSLAELISNVSDTLSAEFLLSICAFSLLNFEKKSISLYVNEYSRNCIGLLFLQDTIWKFLLYTSVCIFSTMKSA